MNFFKKQKNGLFGKVKYGKKSCIAYCKPIAKYDLEKKKWKKPTDDEKGTCFSVAKYNTEFGKKANSSEPNFDYFILLDGLRVENYSKTGIYSGNSGWSMGNYMRELDKSNGRIKALSILVDKDGPLEDEARFLAHKINQLKEMDHCQNIYVLGNSKCGTMTVSMLKYLQDTNLTKLHVSSALAPYLGTIMASPTILYKKADEVIAKIPTTLSKRFLTYLQQTKPLSKTQGLPKNETNISKLLKNFHWKVFSQSHMDYDISLIGQDGVPEEHKSRYDENYLKNLFTKETLAKLKQIDFTNITTYCTPQTLNHSLKTFNKDALAAYLSSQVFFDEPNDGVVNLASSLYIEKICQNNHIPISTLSIQNGHHSVSTDPRMIQQILQQTVLHTTKEKPEEDYYLSH